MSEYSAKNHFEQGGERLVIGGEVAIEEGARVTGLPSAIVLDFHGQSVAQAFGDAVDVTEAIPMEQFLEATRCERPIIFRGLELEGNEVGVQGAATMTGQGIYAMAGYNGNGAQRSRDHASLYTYDDKVWLRVNALIPFEDEYVDGVNMSTAQLSMSVGATAQLYANVEPRTAVNRYVHWNVSDETVVVLSVNSGESVDSGEPVTVTAVGPGTAEITATTDEGGYIAYCQVDVTSAAVEESLMR